MLRAPHELLSLLADPTAQHNWQRYDIALDATALAEARAHIEREATSEWSFKQLNDSAISTLVSVCVFLFRDANDVVVIQSFDRQRRT